MPTISFSIYYFYIQLKVIISMVNRKIFRWKKKFLFSENIYTNPIIPVFTGIREMYSKYM